MKVRLRFSKTGEMRFIGHLDLMRFFQKAMRRANIPIAFSEGMSPHMIMSFAAPLGVGVTSEGEYMDMELSEAMTGDKLIEDLNACMAAGLHITGCWKIEEGRANKAMSLVAASSYLVSFREGHQPDIDWKAMLPDFFRQTRIIVSKKTKKGPKETDIRPMVLKWNCLEDDRIFLLLDAGSESNLKPELLMEAFLSFCQLPEDPFAFCVHRLDLFAKNQEDQSEALVSLGQLGEAF